MNAWRVPSAQPIIWGKYARVLVDCVCGHTQSQDVRRAEPREKQWSKIVHAYFIVQRAIG
jgi:hypothetical protein